MGQFSIVDKLLDSYENRFKQEDFDQALATSKGEASRLKSNYILRSKSVGLRTSRQFFSPSHWRMGFFLRLLGQSKR